MLDVPQGKPASTGSPEDLVALIAIGRLDAEREFVRRYEKYVKTLVRQHCRPNDPEVPDLVQDVLTTVLEKLRAGAVLHTHALPSYIQTTVVRATNAEYRRRIARPQADTDAVESALDQAPDTADEFEREERATLVREVISELPMPRDRELLRRFCIEEENKETVCRDLQIDPSHFHRVTFRARQRLGELLRARGLNATPGETTRLRRTPA